MIIEEYQTQVRVLDKQIRDVKKELDWLVLKINRIADSGRKVPKQLKFSVSAKEKKIILLEKHKLQLVEAISRYEKANKARIKRTEKKHAALKARSEPVKSYPIAGGGNGGTLKQGKISDIELAIKKAGLDDWVQVVNGDGGCAKVNSTLPILFSSGSADLAKEYKFFIKKIADFLKPYDVKVYVNGYADSDPIHTKKYSSNFELGASRAANIVHEMIRYGLKPEIFQIGTTGEHRFSAKASSQKKSFQRRAQFTVVFNG